MRRELRDVLTSRNYGHVLPVWLFRGLGGGCAAAVRDSDQRVGPWQFHPTARPFGFLDRVAGGHDWPSLAHQASTQRHASKASLSFMIDHFGI